MPSHPKGKQPKTQGKAKGAGGPGGPLKRSGESAHRWDEIIGPSISIIPANQLPQVKTILQRYRSLRIDQPLEKTFTQASHIAEEVTDIWTRARIPVVPLRNVINRVVKEVEWWNSNHNMEPRSPEHVLKLFDIAPKLRGKASEEAQLDHVKHLMRQECGMMRGRKSEGDRDKYDWEVDFQFYVDQAKGDRVQTLGVVDVQLHQVETVSEERAAKRAKYYERQTSETSTSQASLCTGPDSASDTNQSGPDPDDDEYQPPTQPPSPEITLTLPRKALLSGTAELATRCQISHRKALAITAKLVKMGGGDLNQCSLSASTSLRQRTAAVKESEEKIKIDFAMRMPSQVIVHWDGKVIKFANRKESDERLAIVLSSPNLDSHTQFLSAPHIPDGTGASMRDALMATLQVWDIPKDNVVGMSWDTTASNTGQRKGSATLFEQELDKAILWLACRHHIGELHIKHADVEARGPWAGPTDKLFEQFRERFAHIQVPQQLRGWDWPDAARPHTFLVSRALDVREFLEQHLLQDDFGRDDYRELCELIIKFLGGEVIRPRRRPGAVRDDFVMRAPGALHHARFLASCLYILKLVMLSDVAPPGLLTPGMLTNLKRMAQYISLFHGPWFLQARVPTVAPRLDLELWRQMGSHMYEDIDAPVANAVR